MYVQLMNIKRLSHHLQILTHARKRRGLLNIIVSVSKSLFGTLDDDDLKLVNDNIDKLFDDENKLKIIIANQTSLIRKIVNSDGLKRIEQLSVDKELFSQQVQRDKTITLILLRLETAMQDVHFQIDEITNVITFAKQGIINPQIIDEQQFIEIYARAISHQKYNPAITPEIKNFQFILDISSLKVFTVNRKLFFKISVPLISDQEWSIYQVYPIPVLPNNVFMAPAIEHQIYLTSGLSYMNIDVESLPTLCTQKIGITICKQTQPIHDRTLSSDCHGEIISFSQQIKHCQIVIYKIEEISFVKLRTDNRYIAIPQRPIEINVICGTHHEIQIINEVSLLKSNKSCDLIYHNEHMRKGKSKLEISYELKIKGIPLPSNKSFEILLDSLEKTPKIINDEILNYKTTIDKIDDQVNQLTFERRIKDAKYWGITTIQVLGYLALAIAGIMLLKKIGLFDLIGKCVPTKICIQLLCCKVKKNSVTNNTNNSNVNSVPSAPNIYDSLPMLQLKNPIEDSGELPEVLIKPRRVKFSRSILKRS